MNSLIQAFKSILGIRHDDEDEEGYLERDLVNYSEIVNSTKYADSNSNTDALENVIKALEETNPSKQKPKQVESAVQEELEGPDPTTETDTTETAADPRGEDKLFAEIPSFNQRLRDHLNLLQQLEDESYVIPGQPCHKISNFRKHVFQVYAIPKSVYNSMITNQVSRLNLKSVLTKENYVKKFQTLLWVEEAQQDIEMRRYDQNNVLLGKFESFFLINVPGLAEGRPSLMRGDRLILRGDKRDALYEGYIHNVREHDILFKLHENLHNNGLDGLRFQVSFMSSRTPWRRCHFGVSQVTKRKSLLDVVFPMPNMVSSSKNIHVKEANASELRCFTPELNKYQRNAVINILKGNNRPAPYILFGPCGTGKTVTVVEAALQVYARDKQSRVLLCGNSNNCADLLARKCLQSGVIRQDELLRLSAFYRMEKLVPEDLKDITCDLESLTNEPLEKCRVMITTCIQSGCLYELDQRYDFVFVDEAGHANEPQAMISIGLMREGGSCVLAGDHQQLGPVCISNVASDHGLDTSMLERLSKRVIYQRKLVGVKMTYDERYISKLIFCYRSDPRVLTVNNQLFYDNELLCLRDTPQEWLDVLGTNNPLIFHHVDGRNRREYTNPSWFNPSEAVECLKYIKRLYQAGLEPSKLGVITPYRRQIDKIHILLDSCGLPRCKIATMEEFQGDEREIIIITTVRTNDQKLAFDAKFKLGFLFNPKRFNVGVSRAKWAVIVIGNEEILKKDSCWVKYIEHAKNVAPTTAPKTGKKKAPTNLGNAKTQRVLDQKIVAHQKPSQQRLKSKKSTTAEIELPDKNTKLSKTRAVVEF